MLVFFTWNGFNRFLLGLKWAYWGYRRNSRRKDDSTVICFHFKSTLVQLALAFYFSGLQIMRDSELKPLLFDCQWVRQSTCFPRKDSPSEPLPTGNEWMNERMNGWKKKRRRHLEGFAQWIVAKEGRPGGGVGDCRFHDNRATPAPTTSTSNGFEWRHRRSVRSLINCLGSQRHRVPRRHGKWVGDLPSTHTHTHTHTHLPLVFLQVAWRRFGSVICPVHCSSPSPRRSFCWRRNWRKNFATVTPWSLIGGLGRFRIHYLSQAEAS